MNYRGISIFIVLLLAAAGSWLLAPGRRAAPDTQTTISSAREGYYLIDARVRGIGRDGKYLYELVASEAAQSSEQNIISLQGVRVSYSPSENVPWTLRADSGTLNSETQQIRLVGNVRAESSDDSVAAALTTSELEIDPASYIARTDKRVTIQVGSRSLTATGMLAFLNEDRIELQSNVSGKFLP